MENKNIIIPSIDFTTEYRWYYNKDGIVTVCVSNSANFLATGEFCVVSKEIYDFPHKFIIKNGIPVPAQTDGIDLTSPLKKSSSGFRVAKNNAGLLLEEGENLEFIEYYEYRNS